MRRRLVGRRCGELDEDPAAGTRMQERDTARQPVAGYRIDELRAAPLEAGERVGDVRRLEAEMMQSLTSPFEKSPDAGARVDRLQELDLGVAGPEERRPHPLIGDRLLLQQGQAEHVTVEAIGVG